MAYELTGFRTLVIKNGLSGTPQAVSGTPRMWQSSETLILANIEASTNSGYSAYWWDTDPMNNIRMRYGVGGISIAQYVANVMSIGDKAYLYNPEIGDSFALIIYRDSNTSAMLGARMGGTDVTGYYSIQGIGAVCDDREGVMMSPWVCLGFAKDPDTGKANVYNVNILSNWNAASFNWQTFSTSVLPSISQVCQIILLNNSPLPPVPPSTDPYEDGGYSTDATSGTGSFDATSEAVSEPSTPSVSPMVGNFINQYVVSQTALSTFGAWLWGGGSIFDDLKQLFQSPIEAVVNVGILPFEPDYDGDNYDTIKVGGLSSTASGHLIQDNYFTLDCGTITFDPYYGSALDQNPYTKCEIYLPYCGVYPLNVDEIMGHTISLKYFCDTLSGDCVAVISDEERVLEQVRGNVFVQIPFSAKDFTSVYTSAINGAISIAASAATVYATGGLSAPVAVGAGTSIAANALNSKTHVTRAGGFSGMAGLMSVQTPYVILTVPNQCLPEYTNAHQGYPCMVTKRLGDFTGFTKVYEIHLDGLDCTDAESKEIYELLKGGVIL